jgi:long-subunit acyl-CoA synthetase (AMP-forming)
MVIRNMTVKLVSYRGLGTGIYTTNSPEACFYVAQSASCNIIVVDTDSQLQKILQVRHRLPELKAIVQYRGELKQKYNNVYTVLLAFCCLCFQCLLKNICYALCTVINLEYFNKCLLL